jgi:Spy/CpxP family protein refolding chaperone
MTAVVLGGLVALSNMAMAQDDGTNAAPRGKKGKGGFMTIEQRMEQWTKDLTLTDDQKPKFKEALEDTAKKMREVRQDTSLDRSQRQEKMKTIMEDQNKAMKKILTDDQYKKYEDKLKEERKGKKGGKKKAASE